MWDRPRVEGLAFRFGVAGILVVAFLLRAQTLRSPIEGGVHDLGIRQALAARNFLVHGIIDTRGAMVLNGGPAGPDELDAYAHHPTLLPLILAGAFAIFGDSLPVYRVTLILISIGSIALLMRIVRATGGRIACLAAGWVSAVCPMSAFYATGGDVLGDGLNLFMLAGVAFRVLGRSPSRRAAFAAELACYGLGALFDWSGLLAFGIPLVDAIIGRPPRGWKRGFIALGAGVLAFALIFAWAHVVVPARFPETDKVGGTLTKWTFMTVVNAWRETPELVRFGFSWFLKSELELWTVPFLAAIAAGLGGVLIAALRGRFAQSGARIVVLLLAPGLAYVVLLTACFLAHLHAAIQLLPAFAAAAALFASFLFRLGVLGRCAVLAWAVWCGWQGMSETRNLFWRRADPGIHAVSLAAAAQSAPDTLIATSHQYPWVIAHSARRNVVESVLDLGGHPKIDAYLAKHPGAAVLFLLPPMLEQPPGHPEHGSEATRYEALTRALEARSPAQAVAGWRIYSLK